MSDKRSINIIGNILMLLSFAFIVDRIIKYRIDFNKLISMRTFSVLIISVIVYAMVVVVIANVFYALLDLYSDNEIPKKNAIYIYCKSNLYKYLPGNIFHFVGRNQIALDEGTSHSDVVAATFAEIVLQSVAAVSLAIVLAGKYAYKWVQHNYSDKGIITLLLFIVIIVIIVLTVCRFNSKIKEWALRYANQITRIRFYTYLKFLMVYLITFIINGAMFIMVLDNIGGHINKNLILPVIGMYAFSWFIGFVTPGAPAGLGIREAIMSILLTGFVEIELVIAAVVIYRIVTTLGDVASYFIAHQLKV